MTEKLEATRTKTSFFMTNPRRKTFIVYEGDHKGGLRFNSSFFDRIIRASTHRKGHAAKANPCCGIPRVFNLEQTCDLGPVRRT